MLSFSDPSWPELCDGTRLLPPGFLSRLNTEDTEPSGWANNLYLNRLSLHNKIQKVQKTHREINHIPLPESPVPKFGFSQLFLLNNLNWNF